MAGVMLKLRERVWIVIVAILVAMVFFLFLGDKNILALFNDEQARGNLAGEVGGEEIKAPHYAAMTEYRASVYELLGQEVTVDQLRDPVWQEVVTNHVLRHELGNYLPLINDHQPQPHPDNAMPGLPPMSEVAYHLGYTWLDLAITDREWESILIGPDALPQARQLYGGIQSMQQLNQQLQQIEQQRTQNAEVASIFYRIRLTHNMLRQQYLRNKFTKYVGAGVQISDAKAKREWMNRQRKASGEVLAINYATIADSVAEAQLTDADYNAYYDDYKGRFKQQQKSAVISYVAVPKLPTRRDTADARKYAEETAKDFAETDNMAQDSMLAMVRTSPQIKANARELPFDFQWKPLTEYNVQTQRAIEDASPGDIIGPVRQGPRFVVTKLSDRSTADSLQTVKAKHILLQYRDTTAADTQRVMNQAQVVLDSLESGMEFAAAAQRFSADQRSLRQGGSLGWVYPNMFGKDFLDQIRDGQAGQTLGPVTSPAGVHIVRVEERSSEVFKVAKAIRLIAPGEETRDSLQRRAGKVVAEYRKDNDIEAAAKRLGMENYLRSTEDNPITPATSNLPGLQGEAVSRVISFALTNPKGKLSDQPISVDNAYVVALIRETSDASYRPLEMVKEQIKPEVLKRKKHEMIAGKLSGGGDLKAMKAAYGQGALILPLNSVSFSSQRLPGLGTEPAVIGTLFGLEKGQQSAPIRGNIGTYVVKLTSISEPKQPSEKEIEQEKTRLERQLKRQFSNQAFQGAQEALEVKDYRYLRF